MRSTEDVDQGQSLSRCKQRFPTRVVANEWVIGDAKRESQLNLGESVLRSNLNDETY